MWVVGALVLWVLLALAVGVVLGRGIRIADVTGERARATEEASGAERVRTARRRIPLPPVGIGLAATAVLLETTGYVVRLTGVTGPVARALSMDAPWSAPRTFVAALFAAAAVAAVTGAARVPGRRTWWLAVGLVCAAVAVVKAGGTVHVGLMASLDTAVGGIGAVVAAVVLAAGVLAVLAFISRAERRDRRRVLGSLAAYAAASVGLSAVSTVAAGRWAATATYLEESGEALAGVAVLVAVLVGVAPRLVLPASWALRREEDAAESAVAERLRRAAQG